MFFSEKWADNEVKSQNVKGILKTKLLLIMLFQYFDQPIFRNFQMFAP